ncbi:LacI family DNA-binding transcriptional regulator [Desertivirga arenae]|uniref:LacI family DNA-binding transcriptional regulator n=1 Tax=Desertivirga arenae TaxID=2810309 RepID=UPI00350FC0E9
MEKRIKQKVLKASVTLKKLADMLNLSVSTVSRALKDHPDISESTKQKIRDLAAVLEYEPNTYAINLRTNGSREFGVIVPSVSNYFYQSFISSLEEEARLYGYSLLILQSGDDPLIEQENLKRCRQTRVAGVFVAITSSTVDLTSFLKLTEIDIPVIFFDKVPSYEACNKVCVGDTSAAVLGAEALVQKGKLNILAVFGDPRMSITRKREEAFTHVIEKAELETTLTKAYAGSFLEALTVTEELLTKAERPDAIFCMSDEILTGVMKCLQKLNLKTPQDIGVIAISDGFIPTLYYPEITYAETSGTKLAKLSFTRMLSCLSGSPFVQELRLDSILVEGGSL